MRREKERVKREKEEKAENTARHHRIMKSLANEGMQNELFIKDDYNIDIERPAPRKRRKSLKKRPKQKGTPRFGNK